MTCCEVRVWTTRADVTLSRLCVLALRLGVSIQTVVVGDHGGSGYLLELGVRSAGPDSMSRFVAGADRLVDITEVVAS